MLLLHAHYLSTPELRTYSNMCMGKKTERVIEHRLEKATQLLLRGNRRVIPVENYREKWYVVTIKSFVKTRIIVNFH